MEKSPIDIFVNNMAVDDQEKAIIKNVLVPKKVYKKQMLLKTGEVARHIFFVTKGCLRSYTIDATGAEHIFQFAIEGWVVSDMHMKLKESLKCIV